MRKNFGAKSWMLPMPVLIVGTYNEDGTPDAMNAAWGGIYESNQIMISLAESHRTTENIRRTGVFTVSFGTAATAVACDYVGIVSAKVNPEKVQRAGWHATAGEHVNAPLFAELPMALECRLLKFNEDGICIGEIVNVSADERVLDGEGRIDARLLDPLIYDGATQSYWRFGERVGQAFSDGKQLL